MKPTVYIETTIISYLTAWPSRDALRLSHEEITRRWWAQTRPHYELFVSDVVIQEASAGDPTAAAERLIALQAIPSLSPSDASKQLAEQLVNSLRLPPRARLDAAHIAIASMNGISFLLTWNCRHLANGALWDKIDRTCAAFGVVPPHILTPELLTEPLP
jgi:hypothetical protein